MKAAILRRTGKVRQRRSDDRRGGTSATRTNQVRLRMRACGVCRTDLHIVEGDLPALRDPLIPGHQIVGDIVEGGTPDLPLGSPCWRFLDGRCRRNLQLLPRWKGKPLRFADLHGLHGRWGIRRICRGAQRLRVSAAPRARRSACRAAALRGDHRLSQSPRCRSSTWRACGFVRLRRVRPPDDRGLALLELQSVRLHARRSAPPVGPLSRGGLGGG